MNPSDRPLILASQSPRRQQLLRDAGFAFEVDAPDDSVEQQVSKQLAPKEFVAAASLVKASAIAARYSDAVILAADTIAECDGQILGKPADRSHAGQMLKLMSGRQHRVLTGVCLWDCRTGESQQHVEQTTLVMTEFPPELLETYLDSQQWKGKAGAFGYQDGLDWVRVVSGLESNVVGLPVERLAGWLEDLAL